MKFSPFPIVAKGGCRGCISEQFISRLRRHRHWCGRVCPM